MKKSLGVVIAVVVLLVVAFAIRPTNKEEPEAAQVNIAGNLPLTGFLAQYGIAVRDGAVMAAEEVAANQPGARKLVFDWQDNNSDSKTALTVGQAQLLKSPVAYISGIGPSLVNPVAGHVAKRGIPHFVWTFDVNIRTKDQQNNFRANVSYKLEPQVYLDYARSRHVKRVAILHLLLPHAVEEFNAIVVPGLKEMGAANLLVEPFEIGKADFSDLAAKVRTFSPDLIILNGFQMDLVNMIKALRAQDCITDGNAIGTFDMMDAMSVLSPAELEGIRAVVPAYIVAPTPTSKVWTERFVAKYGHQPIYSCAFGYDAATALADAAKRLDLPATPEQWCAAIAATDLPDGITGPLKFDAGGDLLVPLAVGVFREGKLVLGDLKEQK